MRRTSWMMVLGLAVALVISVRVEEGRFGKERRRVAALALEASNAAAERDSTREVALTSARAARLLGDSLRIVERRVVQVHQAQDALDAALGSERAARYRMAASVDSLLRVAETAAVTDTTSGTRRARFEVRQTPYMISADVSIPVLPDSARMTITVALDSIPMDLRLGCDAPNRDGIRAASVDVVMPRWATVRFSQVEQTPELCASPSLVNAARPRHGVGFTPLTAGFGRTLALDGRWGWGLFIGVGVSAW